MNNVCLLGRLATDVDLRSVSDFPGRLLHPGRRPQLGGVRLLPREVLELPSRSRRRNLVQGRRIAVEGALRQDTYERDGEERKIVSIVARRVEYL